MNRRDFLKFSSLALFPIWACQEKVLENSKRYNFEINSDMSVGHLLFESASFPQKRVLEREYFIVGGGVAGVSAGFLLRDKSLVLCELSDRLGGSASNRVFNGVTFSQGAHYDLNYPPYFGKETLQLLYDAKIIKFDNLTQTWGFIDKKYYIEEAKNTACLYQNQFYESVFINDQEAEQFLKIVEQFTGKLLLPTRLIAPEFQYLDKISFADYLQKEKISVSETLQKAIDYQMIDDFGGTSQEISAMAGLFYYAGRKYSDDRFADFSPPEGNSYFIQKFVQHFPNDSIFLNHLVKKITETKTGFTVEVIDTAEKEIVFFKVKKIIYAGHKHALKYIYPPDASLFASNRYAPWLVVNLVFDKDTFNEEAFWQNEILTGKKGFLGFVDSFSQKTDNKYYRVLSAYYCLAESERSQLREIEKYAPKIIENTLLKIASHFQVKQSYLEKKLNKSFLKVMGHAMPIPYPNYLFQNKNTNRSNKNLVYAGVDSGRLPLFFEAVDSGVEAVQILENYL